MALTPKQKERNKIIRKVIKDYKSGKYTQHQLAEKYGVWRSTIQRWLEKA